MSEPISRVGFGASAIGNLNCTVSESDAQRVLDAAFEGGIRYFDTSPLYGYGLSELRLGAFVRRVGRNELTLSTKVGRVLQPTYGEIFEPGIWHDPLPAIATLDYSYDGTLLSLEQSYHRTGEPYFDVVFIHDIDYTTHGDDFDRRLGEVIEGAYRALSDLKKAGHIGQIGIGVNNANAVERFLDFARLDCIMLAGEYTLYRQTAQESLIPRLQAMDNPPRLILAGVFNSGALADPKGNLRIDYQAADSRSVDRILWLSDVADQFGIDLRAAALHFALAPTFVDQVVIGASRADQVTSNLNAIRTPIPSAFWDAVAAHDEGMRNVGVY